MCGICGTLNFETGREVDREAITRMTRSLAHRGPDGEGFHFDRGLGLGHRRLAIIDLSEAGAQPMTNEDGSLWLVLNGEIYNYLELRRYLLGKGHRFRSNSDTEVILHLYEEEGLDCLTKLNGMFALALWDAPREILFAARDHAGIKPFYYHLDSRGFSFASEIKALFGSGLVRPEINPTGLQDYLTFQFCLEGKTLFKGVEKLLPGHYLVVRRDGRTTCGCYWRVNFDIDFENDEEYFERELQRLIEDSVRLQLRSDVPVGTHLSGGLDSSSIACVAASQLSHPLATFTGGFREADRYDETGYARQVAAHIGSEHHEVFPTAEEFLADLPKMIYAMDEPAAGPGLFPQYRVSKLAAEKVKVVLGGQGGDELFAGYIRYLVAYLEACLKGGIEQTQEAGSEYVITFDSILPNLGQLQGYEPMIRKFWKTGVFGNEAERYFRLIDRSEGLHRYLKPEALEAVDGYVPFEAFRELFYAGGCKSLINKMLWFDQKTLLPALLQVEDRTSMAFSLESRVPLLDPRICQLAASMPPLVKYRGGASKAQLRKAMRFVLPDAILQRKDKMGFPVPLADWCAKGPVREFVRETLLSQRARQRGYLQADAVENLVATQGTYDRALWGLLSLELWMQTFLDGQVENVS